MRETVLHGERRVPLLLRSIHRLQEEVAEIERLESLGHRRRLRKDELQLVARREHEWCVRLRADADPVDARRCALRAVRLDRDLEAGVVQRRDELLVELQQRLATGADDERPGAAHPLPRPLRHHGARERGGILELPAVRTGPDEVGIAEGAGGVRAILLAAAPEVAPGEAQEHRGPSRVRALALERVEDLLDGVAPTHRFTATSTYAAGSTRPAWAKPRSRSWQASQRPHAAPSGAGS